MKTRDWIAVFVIGYAIGISITALYLLTTGQF